MVRWFRHCDSNPCTLVLSTIAVGLAIHGLLMTSSSLARVHYIMPLVKEISRTSSNNYTQDHYQNTKNESTVPTTIKLSPKHNKLLTKNNSFHALEQISSEGKESVWVTTVNFTTPNATAEKEPSIGSTLDNEVSTSSSSSFTAATTATSTRKMNGTPVEKDDYIYQKGGWDQAPIVIESHKLVFFTVPKVACTLWKMLFRRMMGKNDCKTRDDPHNPETNGLVYLYDYNLTKATEIMNDPSWIKAMFIRDPKDRFLSAYLDKAVRNNGDDITRMCCPDYGCTWEARESLEGFLKVTQNLCKNNNHWKPQAQRIDSKFITTTTTMQNSTQNKIDFFIGRYETMKADAERLLRRIGAWEEFGTTEWGTQEIIFAGKDLVDHVTNFNDDNNYNNNRLAKYYTPYLEEAVESIFMEDYSLPLFNFTRYKINYNQI